MSDVERRLADRLERLEQQVALISEHLQLPFPAADADATADVPEEVVELARAGRRVEAIKRYGDLTGIGISTATSVVNAIV